MKIPAVEVKLVLVARVLLLVALFVQAWGQSSSLSLRKAIAV